MWDVIVVGAGVFGSTVARHLQNNGRRVLVIDDDRPMSGTAPSGFLMKPTWFASMRKEHSRKSLEVLHSMYDVLEEQFSVGALGIKLKRQPVFRLKGEQVMSREGLNFRPGLVTEVGNAWVQVLNEIIQARFIVVAAGVWCKKLVPGLEGLVGKVGASFTVPGQVSEAVIRPFAPYRQLVAYNVSPTEIWCGDGTALTEDSWAKEPLSARLKKSIDRMHAILPGERDFQPMVGIRPSIERDGMPCYLKTAPYMDRVWVCTGGAKNGTIAAGWAADELERRTA